REAYQSPRLSPSWASAPPRWCSHAAASSSSPRDSFQVGPGRTSSRPSLVQPLAALPADLPLVGSGPPRPFISQDHVLPCPLRGDEGSIRGIDQILPTRVLPQRAIPE